MVEATDSDHIAVIAVDLGGTTTRMRLVLPPLEKGAPPRIMGGVTFATDQSYAAQMKRMSDVVPGLLHIAEHPPLERPVSAKLPDAAQWSEGTVAGIGVSLGGRIAADGSGVSVAPNLRDYEGRPFVADLSARCGGLPVSLAHDAVCGLLAERRYGALVGAQRCAYLTLSTGTGCALHLEAPQGAGLTLSIELGHQLLDHNVRVCLCGQVGCLETYTGGKQLALRYGQPIETLNEVDSSEMWREFAEKLSIGLVNLAHLTRVERIAIGGAIALHRPSLLAALRMAVTERLRNARLELVAAALGESAPLVGASTLLTAPAGELLH